MNDKSKESWWILRVAFGVVPIVAGADKFFNILANWEGYLSPTLIKMLPLSPAGFMHLVGIIEIVAGVLVLNRSSTRVGAYIVTAWLAAVALNLLTTGHFFDIAVRDLVMAASAFVLGQLSEVEARLPASKPSGFATPRHQPA